MGKPVIIRFPVIPGHTDSDETIEAVGRLLSACAPCNAWT